MRFGFRSLFLCFAFQSFLIASCGQRVQTRMDRAETFSDKEKGSADSKKDTPNVIQRELVDSGAEFQVKRSSLLNASIQSCLGKDLTQVSAEMLIQEAAAPLPNGKVRFLNPAGQQVGKSVIESLKRDLDGPSEGTRTGTLADGIANSDTYLRALAVVADVVAHNCDLKKESCQCGTPELASEMLKRCLPGLNPTTPKFVETAKVFGEACQGDELKNRKAIAALISSYAFASAR